MRYKPFPAKFFCDNRRLLSQRLDEDGLALVFSADSSIRNGDQLQPWRQDSNFFYLTGLEQPGIFLLLLPEKAGSHQEILFLPPVNLEREKWEGKMLTPERASEISGVKKVLPADQFLAHFFRAQEQKNTLYTEVNGLFPDQPLTKAHRMLEDFRVRLPGLNFKKMGPLLVPQRAKKQTVEIDRIRASLGIIEKGLRSVAKKLKPGMMEYQVEAELAFHYLNAGCSRVGFETIVAGGKNACTLHYVENSDPLAAKELVLIDTGGEYGMYSGDITRVLPISGKFTERQAHCYQAVLEVNKTFIRKLRAGLSWKELAEQAGMIQGEIYKKAGVITEAKDYLKVGYHRIGHSLGLDVHDLQIADWPLKAGAVITVEPGLYLPEEGIGIRIEDNVVLTEGGFEVLSANIPKEIADLEALMA